MESIFDNTTKGICVICNMHILTRGRMTCSENCHEKFVKICEEEFGIAKKVIDDTTGIMYKVPTRDIIEKGITWRDLTKYPTIK
jgi:hypothetical protein